MLAVIAEAPAEKAKATHGSLAPVILEVRRRIQFSTHSFKYSGKRSIVRKLDGFS